MLQSEVWDFFVFHGNLRDDDSSLPYARLDALSKYAGGIFVAQAGNGNDRKRWAHERSEGLFSMLLYYEDTGCRLCSGRFGA